MEEKEKQNNVKIAETYYRKLAEIAKRNNRSMVGQVRAWIDENTKEEKIIQY